MDTGTWRDYSSPFDVRKNFGDMEHWHWQACREDFAKTGNPVYLEQMLRYVTMNNPPDAPIYKTVNSASGSGLLWFFSSLAMFAIAIVISLLGIGVI